MSRKFFVIVLDVHGDFVLTERFNFPETRREFTGKFGAATEEQAQAIADAGLPDQLYRNALVIYRRADARSILNAMKFEAPDWAEAYKPKLVGVGEFKRERSKQPIVGWRIVYTKVPKGSSQRVGDSALFGQYHTRGEARAQIATLVKTDKDLGLVGFAYKAVPLHSIGAR